MRLTKLALGVLAIGVWVGPNNLYAQRQKLEGTAVLDVAHFPEISYRSTAITKTGDAHWEVRGNLNLHGKNQLVVVVVSLEGGRYRGSASFKQSHFGINPIRIAGGTVKVKDEVTIEFDIVPVQ